MGLKKYAAIIVIKVSKNVNMAPDEFIPGP